MSRVDNPLKWLLAELPGYIEPRMLDRLMEEYEANKQAYERQIKIRALERIIATNERFAPSADRDARLARWKAKLAKLKEESS
jgi:hypothetical protein